MTTQHQQALDLIADGDWESAHQLIQDYGDKLACMIHGYLHLIEGDSNNANYWYSRAGEPFPSDKLDDEFERLNQLAKNQP